MRNGGGVAACVVAALLAACGTDEGPAPSADAWQEAKIDGLEHASGVTAWRDRLLFSSSSSKSVFEVRADEVKGGATVRCRAVPLDVDGEREASFTDTAGVRSFRLKHLWEGEQRFSGLVVVAPELLYVASESYRLVWFGPLEVAKDGSPVRCRFERAFAAPGAHRKKADASDWHDYGDDTATNGICGLCAAGEDVAVIERAKGADQAFAYRLDRLSGSTTGVATLALPVQTVKGASWFSDIARDGTGFLVAKAIVDDGSAETQILRLARIDVGDIVMGGPRVDTVYDVPAVPPERTAEGVCLADGRLWLVCGDGTVSSPTTVRWRTHR